MGIYIFDLDDTITSIEKRRHFLNKDVRNDINWVEFFDACDTDDPKISTINICNALYEAGFTIYIWSGRSERVKDKTIKWLKDNNVKYHELKMRPIGNYTKDKTLKKRWLDNCKDRDDIIAAFDDREAISELWIKENIPLFHVK